MPNHLKLRQNNDQSPVGVLDVSDRIDHILKTNSNIFVTWWEMWLTSALPKLVLRPKWLKNDEHIKRVILSFLTKPKDPLVVCINME